MSPFLQKERAFTLIIGDGNNVGLQLNCCWLIVALNIKNVSLWLTPTFTLMCILWIEIIVLCLFLLDYLLLLPRLVTAIHLDCPWLYCFKFSYPAP
jgi:hypothetical protein